MKYLKEVSVLMWLRMTWYWHINVSQVTAACICRIQKSAKLRKTVLCSLFSYCPPPLFFFTVLCTFRFSRSKVIFIVFISSLPAVGLFTACPFSVSLPFYHSKTQSSDYKINVSSCTLYLYQSTRRQISGCRKFQNHRSENLDFKIISIWCAVNVRGAFKF